MLELKVNGKIYAVDVSPDTPLLWVLRDTLGLTGTKYGCGISQCGACTVHLDGEAVRSCVTPVSRAAGKDIVTIEGLSSDAGHPVQQAWIALDVPQCGYCMPGQLMSAAALLRKIPHPSDADIDAALTGNICRCGAYQRIRQAVHLAAEIQEQGRRIDHYHYDHPALIQAVTPEGQGLTLGFAPNAFLHIDSNDIVTVTVNHSEMGQGVYTALPMLVAEELEADWSKIRLAAAPVDPAYNHTVFGMQATGGSTSTWSEWERLRQAGAMAKAMLIAAAAESWQVDPATCRAEKGYIIHDPSGRKFSFGELAQKASSLKPPATVALKDSKNFHLIGQPTHRLDTPAKVSGRAVYGIDVKIPGTLTALIARPPVFGAKVKSFVADRALAVPGVRRVVEIERGLAVVADGFWPAKLGRQALVIDWDEGPLAGLDSEQQRREYAQLAQTPEAVAARQGDVTAALAQAAQKLDAVYELPYLAHAPMEPLNCLADVRPDSCDIWTGTQSQTANHQVAVAITGLKPEQVKIHTTLLGGGFGRRGVFDSHFVAEAVQVSKIVQAPVKVIWTREDDLRGGYYRPAALHVLNAGLDAAGKPVAWCQHVVCQSFSVNTPFEGAMIINGVDQAAVEGAANLAYDIPNLLVNWHQAPAGVPTLWWRSVGHSHTAFAVESFLDELAHAAGKDPYDFRLTLLEHQPRHLRVLELAAQKSGWGKPLPGGRGRGLAVHASFGSYVAQVAEVSVSSEGKVKVHRVVCAVDCGPVVNPDIVRAQMEGGIVFGLTAALYGEITLAHGRVQQGNFNDYPMLRLKDMPAVEVYIAPGIDRMGGVGEPGVPPIAPAVANAVFAVTGKRIRRLPIRPEDLK
jgi:isoquinoline 1-oxidoreductase beta subunit